MIEVLGLSKVYGEFLAVSELSLSVQPGQIVGLVGSNGAGKTTTLRCLAGIIPPSRGSIRICGADIAQDPLRAKHALAFFPDEPRLFDYLTIEQHLNFTARMYQVADWQEIGARLLADFELTSVAQSLPGELSRGMKQKVVLACGLLHSPKVLFFDEPLTGLDPLAIRRMTEHVRALGRSGAAIILSSHLLKMLEDVCTHVLILKGGRKILEGTMEEVRRSLPDGTGEDLEDVFFRAIGAGETAP